MRTKLSLTVALLAFTLPLFAQHEHHGKKPDVDPMMEAMIKAGTPGDAHKKLDALAGTWTAKITHWAVPGAPPMTMEGTSEARWIMGGRYLEQKFTGSFMGMPFEGIGYTGYDNLKKQYWSTWVDNFSTSLFVSTGSGDGKSWNFSGMMPDPMTGKDMRSETKIIVTNEDSHVAEMWGPGPDGKNFKMMEITYTRKK